MKPRALRHFWKSIFRKGPQNGKTRDPLPTLRLDPLTVAFRIDLSVPSGVGKEIKASQFIWVSPAGSLSRSVKTLKVLLIPN